MLALRYQEPLAAAAIDAIQQGDVPSLERLLRENPTLAQARFGQANDNAQNAAGWRTLLHIATDWPGNFPNGPATVAALVAAGADVNAHVAGRHAETPLHWAASCDDVGVLDALLDLGADIEATGSVIDGGTALADAVAFGQWEAARRLVERGANTTLWQAAALGLLDRVKASCQSGTTPAREEITNAFWCACHGGVRVTAEYLLSQGADLNWIGHDQLTPLDTARRSGAGDLVEWLVASGARSAEAGI
ncbi:MAG: ankyrin repeat domain-containing protein [Singulisphaera sp.]